MPTPEEISRFEKATEAAIKAMNEDPVRKRRHERIMKWIPVACSRNEIYFRKNVVGNPVYAGHLVVIGKRRVLAAVPVENGEFVDPSAPQQLLEAILEVQLGPIEGPATIIRLVGSG